MAFNIQFIYHKLLVSMLHVSMFCLFFISSFFHLKHCMSSLLISGIHRGKCLLKAWFEVAQLEHLAWGIVIVSSKLLFLALTC